MQMNDSGPYLHPDDGVDEEEHHDEESYVRKSLETQTTKFKPPVGVVRKANKQKKNKQNK